MNKPSQSRQQSATHETSTVWNNTSRRQLLLAHFENPWNARVLLIFCDSNTSSLVGVTRVKRKAIQSFNPEMKPEAFISSSSFQRKCLEVFAGWFLTVSWLRNGLSGAIVQSHISLDSWDRRVFLLFVLKQGRTTC
ncbi:hypothetical protein CDAR_623431 [Caerostris darwini]|uniref:Uncharacterized protein n=1 Tax=Caerostris darwini TaxID=1538125 RepID=A0AAV4SQS7_9ARAC|nr:hypothetical protein CDAR_623431 [Caerostris darwini]